jgi:hypothetical protein
MNKKPNNKRKANDESTPRKKQKIADVDSKGTPTGSRKPDMKHEDPKTKPEESEEPKIKPKESEEPKKSEESEEPKIKPKKPKESEEPKIKPKKPKESEEPKIKPKESEEPKIKPKKPKESEEPKMKPTVPEVILIDSDSDDSKPTPVDTVPVTREEIIEVRNVPKMDIDTEITPIPGSKGLARLRIRIRINPDDLTINPGGPIIGRKTRIGVKVGPRTEDDKSRVKVKVSTSPVHRSTNFME